MGESLSLLRAGDDSRKSWREINKQGDELRELRRQVSALTTGVASLRDIKRRQSSGVEHYRLKQVQNDYYRCRTWNGLAEGTKDIYIARPFTHRVSEYNGRTLTYNSDGDTFAALFAYASATKRIVTIAGTPETQVIVPYFLVDFDLICAAESGEKLTLSTVAKWIDPDGKPITLVDLNPDGRAWTKL